MIERIKRWWHGTEIGRQNVTTGEGDAMSEEDAQNERNTLDMKETQQLLKESREKSRQASVRLDDYQARVQAEYAKRIELARAGRKRNG